MERLQMILKAKNYLELMSHSIDPITQEAIEDSVLQKNEVKEMLLYISTLLDELIANEGEVINIASPIEFSIERINKNLIAISDQPIQITSFVKRINNQVDNSKMKTLKPSRLTGWLLENGYLNKDIIPVLKNETVYSTTSSSKDIGIVEQDKINAETGEIKKSIVLTKMAQEFIVDNLENITGLTENINLIEYIEEHNDTNMVGQKWSKEEQNNLVREFVEEKLTIKRIADIHHRNVGGIRARLIKIGLIDK